MLLQPWYELYSQHGNSEPRDNVYYSVAFELKKESEFPQKTTTISTMTMMTIQKKWILIGLSTYMFFFFIQIHDITKSHLYFTTPYTSYILL